MDIFITEEMKELPTSDISEQQIKEWICLMGVYIQEIAKWRREIDSIRDETLPKIHYRSRLVDEIGFEKFCPDASKRNDEEYIFARLAEVCKHHRLFFPRKSWILKNVQVASVTPSQIFNKDGSVNTVQYFLSEYDVHLDGDQYTIVYNKAAIPISELFVLKEDRVRDAIRKIRKMEAHLKEDSDPSYKSTCRARLEAARTDWATRVLNGESVFNEL